MNAVPAVPIRIGDTEVLIELTPVSGSEDTSRGGDVGAKVVHAFDRAQDVIVALSERTAAIAEQVLGQPTHPEEVKVELGIGLTTHGNVIVAGASAPATLRVSLTYRSPVT